MLHREIAEYLQTPQNYVVLNYSNNSSENF